MPNPIIEDNWPSGWIPSNDLQKDAGDGYSPSAAGLLRMDNLTLDSRGTCRLARAPGIESSVAFVNQINSIFGAYFNPLKYRYIYDSTGLCLRNYGPSALQAVYDLTLLSGGTSRRAAFLNALGAVFICCGDQQIFDLGATQFPLGLPAAAPPVLTQSASDFIDMDNLDGSGNYTNWYSLDSSAFDASGTEIDISPDATTLISSFQTVYAAPLDTTNFGSGTGMDQPTDVISFNITVDNAAQLNYVHIDIYCGDPTMAAQPNFWYEWDLLTPGNTTQGTYPIFPISSGVTSNVQVQRGAWYIQPGPSGVQPAWNNVMAVHVQFGFIASANADATWNDLEVSNGNPYSGTLTYVAVELNDTSGFVMTGLASTQETITVSNAFVEVDRSGSAVNANANEIRFYRNDTTLGQFLEVNRQTGAYGFTPVSFIDYETDTAVLEAASLDSTLALQFFRTALTDDVIGMIWFATRVIYLNRTGFYPSYELDPGSYDSRWFYQLIGEVGEICLFITAINVGTLIISTTKDFYQVTGTFTLQTTTNADGSTTTIQDVTIQKLGISDAAISSQFMEVEGTIMYLSATGVRSLNITTSTSLNTSLELLFRNESRFGFPNISLAPQDQSNVACVSSGYRIYWSLPCSDGFNHVFVSTFNIPTPAELRGASYWRLLTNVDPASNPSCLYREDDGTIIFGGFSGASNYIQSLENNPSGPLPVYLQSQLNFGSNPMIAKKAGALGLVINTGGVNFTVTVYGIDEDGIYYPGTYNVNTPSEQLVYLPVESLGLDPEGEYLGFYITITGTSAAFSLNYFFFTVVLEYPPVTYYEIMLFTNFGRAESKKISTWPIVVDDRGHAVYLMVRADETTFEAQSYAPVDEPSTVFWNNDQDIKAVDWQMEVIAPNGMRFYKFMPPTFLQVFPIGKLLDQLGPFELDRQGIIFGFRLRILTSVTLLNYLVYDQDVVLWDGANDVPAGIATVPGVDSIYEVTLPKGVNSSVCRIMLSAAQVFYRFTLELKVRSTGKETEEKWITIK